MAKHTGAIRRQIPLLLILIGVALIMFTFSVGAAVDQQTASQGQQIFTQNCSGCHTVGGGKLVGPDLKGVTALRDKQWLQAFIQNPNSKFDSGDPIATQLLADFNNLRMPALGLSAADVDSVLAYLESATGAPQPTQATTGAIVGNPTAGERIFIGQNQLINGGTPCIGCHTVGGTGALGGGALGPDLSKVMTRLGEPGLTAALTNVNFPTMVGIFGKKPLTPQEVADLVAYFKQADARPAVPVINAWVYLGVSAGGAIIIFLVMLIFWPRQRRSISEKLRAGKL